MTAYRRSRPRRRAERVSDAVDYDRTADAPAPTVWSDGADSEDDEGAVDRLLNDRPPHYGGD